MLTSPLPHFTIIYADPPWMYKNWAKKGGASCLPALNSGTAPYPCMSTGDICRLPVGERAASDCVLFLWVVYPMLPDGLAVLKAWGFQFKSAAFTWVKLNPSGRGFAYGLGHWTRTSPEICLLGVRGNPRRVSRSVPNLIVSPRREHSRKPDEVRERIIALCGELPRIELFAREKADGWNAWGNEVASDIDLLSYGNVG